jgi:hypothetical protein
VLYFTRVTVGDDPGPVEPGRPNWPAGSVIYRGRGERLCVADVIPSGEVETFTVLVVEEVDAAAPYASKSSSQSGGNGSPDAAMPIAFLRATRITASSASANSGADVLPLLRLRRPFSLSLPV